MTNNLIGELIAQLAQKGATPLQQVTIQAILDGEEIPKASKAQGYLDQKQAMDFLRCSRTQLFFLRKKGLKSFKLGKKLLFQSTDLTEFVAGLNSKATMEPSPWNEKAALPRRPLNQLPNHREDHP